MTRTPTTLRRGFSLIELLVVVSIIAVLSTVALNSFGSALVTANETATLQELTQLETAVTRLIIDTGKAPNGCPRNRPANPEIRLNTNQAGLLQRPNVQDNGWGCAWTASDVAKWNGPYAIESAVIDPNGNAYWFDPDYFPYQNCATIAELSMIRAIVSRPTGAPWYSCSDLYIEV